jgi:hypothetical protein
MGFVIVDLPRQVLGSDLENACINAAKDMGLRAKSMDEFNKRYSLGSIEEHDDYDKTNMRIGNLIPALRVMGINREDEQNRFYVATGLPFGMASKGKVKNYLSTVSKYLK